MPKHYHVISGMPGYMPNSNDYCDTKRQAETIAGWWVKTFRDDGETWRGSARNGGYWRCVNADFSIYGTTPYYIEVVACTQDCEPEPGY